MPRRHVCIAIGDNQVSAGVTAALAQLWNGAGWTLQQMPAIPAATVSMLTGVSCMSPSACVAVGNYRNNAGRTVPLAETWNGASWTVSLPPNPAGAKAASLNGVSCAPASCTAVGYYQNSAGTTFMLAEVLTGAAWAEQLPANPPGAVFSFLNGVSCTSAAVCAAVGSSENSAGTSFTLAEMRNGSTWTVQASMNPAGSSVLTAVSCGSAGSCTAVGYNLRNAVREFMLAEVKNGTHWVTAFNSTPPGENSALDAVSCSAATSCTATGTQGSSITAGVQDLIGRSTLKWPHCSSLIWPHRG